MGEYGRGGVKEEMYGGKEGRGGVKWIMASWGAPGRAEVEAKMR